MSATGSFVLIHPHPPPPPADYLAAFHRLRARLFATFSMEENSLCPLQKAKAYAPACAKALVARVQLSVKSCGTSNVVFWKVYLMYGMHGGMHSMLKGGCVVPQMVERQVLPKGAILMEYAEPVEVVIVVTGTLDLIIPTTPPDAASGTVLLSPQQAR